MIAIVCLVVFFAALVCWAIYALIREDEAERTRLKREIGEQLSENRS